MELILSGTIRDFKDSHLDFEYVTGPPEKNIVEVNLGLDRKPVYKGGRGKTTHNKELFDQWYRDVEGVNLSKRLEITLKDSDQDGVFTYRNKKFFPIDNELFGNQGRPHNYHFTYEIHSEFTYQGTEVFTFIGDDDLWLFIDGKLVIDLGGVHSALEETIDLQVPEGKKVLEREFETGAMLSLEVGKTYAFDLFFAERHTSKSTFRIDTSVALKPLPLVTLQASDPNAQESPSDEGAFLLQLDHPVEQDLAISVILSGTANEGQDYQAIGSSITIPTGQTEVTVPVRPIADREIEGPESVIMTLLMGEGYDVGIPATASVIIGDSVLPTVTIQVSDDQATEPTAPTSQPDNAVFTVCLDQAAPFDLRIAYNVGGTATEGEDYQPLERSVSIPQGESKGIVTVIPLPDDEPCEADETLTLTLLEGQGYQLGDTISGTAVIREAAPQPKAKPWWLWLLLLLLLLLGCVALFKAKNG